MAKHSLKLLATVGVMTLMAGCAVSAENVDYAALKVSRPRSIVVPPPLNESPNVGATYGISSQVTVPLAEAGYYALSVALVGEAFRQNGLNTAGDIHDVPVVELHDILGADTALYIMVTQCGSKYIVAGSFTVMSTDAKLVDLKSGQTLQTGRVSTSNNEGGNSSGGGLIGILVSAAVSQIVANITDQDYKAAGTISTRLLSTR